jgi:hypothetical protein
MRLITALTVLAASMTFAPVGSAFADHHEKGEKHCDCKKGDKKCKCDPKKKCDCHHEEGEAAAKSEKAEH